MHYKMPLPNRQLARRERELGTVSDDRSPRWPNFKQTEEVYNKTVFLTSKFTVEGKNWVEAYCTPKNSCPYLNVDTCLVHNNGQEFLNIHFISAYNSLLQQ